MAELREAVIRKAAQTAEVQSRFFNEQADKIVECARALNVRFERGGRLFTMGNGGSACDALHACVEFLHPIIEKRVPIPAQALPIDSAMLTAVGNDRDFSLIFAEQISLLAHPEDVVLAISTSGQSVNIERGLRVGHELQCLTVGFSGRDGGRMARLCDFCFIVPSFSIHRIQEAHEVLLHVLWDVIHIERGAADIL
jgi:D-sedoheptulose 7-phosphate isomerase